MHKLLKYFDKKYLKNKLNYVDRKFLNNIYIRRNNEYDYYILIVGA
jgi:hypothetical protein